MLQLTNQHTRLFLSAFVFLLFYFFSSGDLPNRYLQSLDEQLYDFRLRSDLLNTVDERIVILDIDEKSISALGQWPWKRTILAALMDKLHNDYEIKVIGFDSVFPEEEDNSAHILLKQLEENPLFREKQLTDLLKSKRTELDGDSQFAESIIARNVVIGYTFEEFLTDDETYQAKGLLSAPIVSGASLSDVELNFYKAGGYIANYEYLSQAASYGGFFNYPRENSSLRKVPLLYRYNGDIYPSLALRTAMISLDIENIEFLFQEGVSEKNSLSLEFVQIGERKIPVDNKFSVYVPYRGDMYSYPYISIIDVLRGDAPIEVLKDKIVLLGTTAAGLMDFRATPVNDTFVGVEVHANVIGGILDQRFKFKPLYLYSIELVILLMITVLLHFLLPRLGAIGSLMTFSFMLISVFILSFAFWFKYNLVIPMANPILLIITLSFLHIIFDYFVESRQKKRMNRIFGQYIPKELVKELDQNSQEISLAGESRNMSVLFSDVRGFTTISEGLEPSELTQLMNEFLTPITKIIHEQRGTIDKYMGDAVMAFWGAPLPDNNHTEHALNAAFAMKEAMIKISSEFKAKGWPEIKIGIGIGSGNMRVGNMGSEFRMAYTVMGDTVNLGSRLEGLTKNYGVDIIVNDNAVTNAPNYEFRELDRVRVKGKTEPVTIFEPIEKKLNMTPEQTKELMQFHFAVAAYSARQWQKAADILTVLKSTEDKLIYDIYLERIANYQQNPPDENWDGVFTHTSK